MLPQKRTTVSCASHWFERGSVRGWLPCSQERWLVIQQCCHNVDEHELDDPIERRRVDILSCGLPRRPSHGSERSRLPD